MQNSGAAVVVQAHTQALRLSSAARQATPPSPSGKDRVVG